MLKFEHCAGAGRFTVGPGLLDDWLDQVREWADLITYSEVDKNDRARQLKAPGWGAVFGDKGPRDDCAIAWRERVFQKLWAGTITIKAPGYKNKRGWKTDPAEAAFAVLKTVDGIIVVGKMHMPTSIAGRFIYNKSARLFKLAAEALADEWDADAIILDADWNRNLRLKTVRTYMRKLAPKYKTTWKFPLPKSGTFGRGIIDFCLVRGIRVIKHATLMAKSKVSDHVSYRQTLAIKRPRQNGRQNA